MINRQKNLRLHRVIPWSPDHALDGNQDWKVLNKANSWKFTLLNSDPIEFVTVHRLSAALSLSFEEDLMHTIGRYYNIQIEKLIRMHVIFIATSHRYHGLCEGRLNSFSSLLSKTKLYSQLASAVWVRLRVILYYFYDVRTVSLVFFRRRTISLIFLKAFNPEGLLNKFYTGRLLPKVQPLLEK